MRSGAFFLLDEQFCRTPSHPAIREMLRKTPEGRSLLREEQLSNPAVFNAFANRLR